VYVQRTKTGATNLKCLSLRSCPRCLACSMYVAFVWRPCALSCSLATVSRAGGGGTQHPQATSIEWKRPCTFIDPPVPKEDEDPEELGPGIDVVLPLVKLKPPGWEEEQPPPDPKGKGKGKGKKKPAKKKGGKKGKVRRGWHRGTAIGLCVCVHVQFWQVQFRQHRSGWRSRLLD